MEIRDDIVTRSNTETEFDLGLRKYMLAVYNYMSIGLLITALTSYVFANTALGGYFFNIETGQPNLFGWIAIIAPFVMIFMIQSAVVSGNATRAFTLFAIYSAVMGISLTSIFWVYTGVSLLRTFLITSAMFLSMSLYGYTTRRDLTGLGSFLTMGLVGLLIAMVVNIFLGSTALEMTISVAGVFIFTGLTAWDTHKIKEIYDGHEVENQMLSKAIFGALMLYLDFLNLFLMLLRFFGGRRD